MTALKGKLVQTIMYMAQGRTKHEIHKVAMVEGKIKDLLNRGNLLLNYLSRLVWGAIIQFYWFVWSDWLYAILLFKIIYLKRYGC